MNDKKEINKKMILNIFIWLSSAVFGVLSIVYMTMYFGVKQDFQTLETAASNVYKERQIRIWAKDIDGTLILDKIYTPNENDETLGDLMVRHNNDFEVTQVGFSKIVTKIKKTADNTWIKGIASEGTHFVTSSPTYYDTDGLFDYETFGTSNTIGTIADKSLSGLQINKKTIFVFSLQSTNETFKGATWKN